MQDMQGRATNTGPGSKSLTVFLILGYRCLTVSVKVQVTLPFLQHLERQIGEEALIQQSQAGI